MFVYKVKNEKVDRKTFSRFIAENCEPTHTSFCGFGVEIADYNKGEQVTKRLEGRARRNFAASREKYAAPEFGSAVIIYGGVGGVEVLYKKGK